MRNVEATSNDELAVGIAMRDRWPASQALVTNQKVHQRRVRGGETSEEEEEEEEEEAQRRLDSLWGVQKRFKAISL